MGETRAGAEVMGLQDTAEHLVPPRTCSFPSYSMFPRFQDTCMQRRGNLVGKKAVGGRKAALLPSPSEPSAGPAALCRGWQDKKRRAPAAHGCHRVLAATAQPRHWQLLLHANTKISSNLIL